MMGNKQGKEEPEEIETPYPENSSPGKLFEHQATSEPYGATNEAVNFFRLACLLLDVCSEAMRDLLRCKISSVEVILTREIAQHKQNFRTLHNSQKEILFPSNGLVRYHLLDFTMMYSIVRNVCPDKIEPNPNNKTKWGKTPACGDTSLLAAIETIRGCRNNFFAHATEAKLRDSNFKELWTDLEFAVNTIYKSLGQFAVSTTYKEDILNFKTMTMDQKSKKLLLQLTEQERKWNDLIEMEVETDLILEELMKMRKNFKEKRSGTKETSPTRDANLRQTEVYLAKFIQEDEYYVETQIYQKVKQLLEECKCVILVGKERTGKTSMAVRLMFSYIKRYDFVVRILSCPADFSWFVKPNKKNLIFIDNVFDCSEYALSDLKKSFDYIQNFLPSSADQTKRAEFKVHIVMASRPHTKEVAVNKLKINPYLLDNCIIDLDSNDWELNEDDKKEIMRKKMKCAFDLHGIKEEFFSPTQWSHIDQSSSESPFGFPLCAQLFAFDLESRKLGTDFFSNPHSYMLSRVKEIIKRDSTKQTEVLFLLILINHIQIKLLNITENEKCWDVLCDLQLKEQLSLEKTHVDNLHAVARDHREVLIRESPGHVLQFKYQSVKDAVQNYFFDNYTIKAIEILPLHVLFRKKHRFYVLKKATSVFFKRLRGEIKNGNLREVCQYEELKDNQVSKEFIGHMMSDESDFINILHTKDENDFPFMYQLTLVLCEETIQYLLGHTTMKRICSDQELYNQYFYSLLACCKLQENKTLTEYILMAYAERNIQNHFFKTNETNASSKSKEETYISPLLVALKNENKSAMQLLLKYKATFPPVRWQAWHFLHICCEYGVSQFCCPELLASIYEFENEKTLNPENELKRDLDYGKIKSVENEDFKDFVLKLHNLFENPGSPETILLDLVEIPYLDITGELILSFCSMPDVKERAKEMNKLPMNFANAQGNTVLHLYLKLHDYNDGLLEESDDEDIDLENESDCQLHSVEVCNNDLLDLIKHGKVENRNKHLSTIKILCTSGIDINMKNNLEQTPLMIEISKFRPSIETISTLLKYGANPNAQDQCGQTCLHKIIKQNYKNHKTSEIIALLALLIYHNAAVDKKDANGDNLIFLELKRQNPRMKILRFLINVNIDMSVKDAFERNALCFALQLPNDYVPKKERVVRVLLSSKKLNVLSRDKCGRSALGLAILDLKYYGKILQQIVDHETYAYPLHEFIKENVAENIKIQALEFLMLTDSRKSDIRAVNDNLETVLITAAKSCPDMDKLFHFLMTKDIDINARDICQNTALYYLIESNNIELTKQSATIDLLLSKNPFVHDEDGIKCSHSPLLTALKFMTDRSYIVLTESFMYPIKTSLQNPDLESSTITLQSMDVSLNLEIVKKILDIAETDLKAYEADEHKRTYLHYCASSRFTDDKTLPICRRLVELGVDVDKKDKDGLTCVDMAFKYSEKNYHTLVYLLSSCNLENFEIDAALQYLAEKNSLNVKILKYMKENILSRKKTTRNILHYLASVGYVPKSQRKSERDELFDVLQSCFAVDEGNVDSKIPLHIAIEENSSLSCVLNFLRITKSFINKPDSDGNTALHLVLKSEREDIDVLTIVKKMIHFKVNVNNRNKMHRTPLMVAVKSLKERTSTIKAILKEKPDLFLKDRSGFTILHHCIEAKKDDFTACSLLSLFLDSGLPVPLKSYSEEGLTPLNLAATNGSYSRVLCILRLVHNKECMADTVDDEGRNPLYNAADSLPGINPLIVLERLIRSYIFLRQEDNPYLKTNKGDNVLDVCKKSKYRSLGDLLKTKKTCEETSYNIIKKAWIDVSRKLFEKSIYKFEDVFLWDNPLIPTKIETLIAHSLPYLLECRLDLLKDEVPEEDFDNESSVLDLENVK